MKNFSAVKQKTLWLPTVIENPCGIKISIYQAISSRKVKFSEAKNFAIKAGLTEKISNVGNYFIRAITGRSYKLKYFNEQGSCNEIFTEWVVCLCDEFITIPSIKENDVSSPSELKKAICCCNNSALYKNNNIDLEAIRKDMGRKGIENLGGLDDEEDFDDDDL